MNSVLRKTLTNPWLSSLVSFLPILALLFVSKVGAGAFAGRLAGAALMVAGIVLICRF
jgi:hypothetical protein